MNSTKFSVMDASKVFKKSRTTIYESLKNGELSRDNNGLIDLSELIRVYGNPISVQSSTRTKHVQEDAHVHIHSEIENLLKEQISLLKNQLDLANQREKSLVQHIEDLTYRIDFKGKLESSVDKEEKNDSPITEDLATNTLLEKIKKPIKPYILTSSHVEPEPEKRSFWSRFFKPYG